MHHILEDPILLQALKLLLAVGFGILFTPFILVAFSCVFVALLLLFPAFCVFYVGLLLFKILFKCDHETNQRALKEEQESIELDPSEFSFGFYDSEDKDSRSEISETSRLSKYFRLWHHWNPDSVEIPEHKPFHELLSFWRRLEKPEVKQRENHQIPKLKP